MTRRFLKATYVAIEDVVDLVPQIALLADPISGQKEDELNVEAESPDEALVIRWSGQWQLQPNVNGCRTCKEQAAAEVAMV